MLDFYLINETKILTNKAKKQDLAYLGSIDSDFFDLLKTYNIIDQRFDFYTDFKQNFEMILQIRDKASLKKLNPEKKLTHFIEILEHAISKQSGLIAYSD